VLRLYDDRAQAVAEVTPARGRELRVGVRLPQAADAADLGDLRRFLVADLIKRTVQVHRQGAAVLLETGDAGAGPSPAFLAACSALNIYPAEPSAPPVRVDLWAGDGADAAARSVRIGPVTFGSGPWSLAGLAERGLDPLALRLAFLEARHAEPLDLTWPALAAADAGLREWRRRVAGWATEPSKPMSAERAAEIVGGFDADLDTPATLRMLDTLGDDDAMPAGEKFETLAYLDQLLGLDVASQVGRVG
jgi:cysteinyl-tRNA synthetase